MFIQSWYERENIYKLFVSKYITYVIRKWTKTLLTIVPQQSHKNITVCSSRTVENIVEKK